MLTLTRNEGQSVYIDENIKLTIRTINGKQVKIDFEAPKSISIQREEIQERILADRRRDWVERHQSNR